MLYSLVVRTSVLRTTKVLHPIRMPLKRTISTSCCFSGVQDVECTPYCPDLVNHVNVDVRVGFQLTLMVPRPLHLKLEPARLQLFTPEAREVSHSDMLPTPIPRECPRSYMRTQRRLAAAPTTELAEHRRRALWPGEGPQVAQHDGQ